MVNFTKGEGRLVDKVRGEAAIPHEWFLGGHFSPECLTQTIIMLLEMANGRGSADMPQCPAASEAIKEIVSGILALANYREIKRLERALGNQPVEVRMCAYGYSWQKPTMIWHNF